MGELQQPRNNNDLESKVRRINLKLIFLNQLKWILDKLFRILHRHYQPMKLYFTWFPQMIVRAQAIK